MCNLDARKQHNAKLINRALYMLTRFEQGKKTPKKLVRHKLQGELYKLDLGMCYRLLSTDKVNWWIVTHENYNNIIK